jgi:Xaa-Pro aminopeptidase
VDHASRRARLTPTLEETEAQAVLVTRLPNVRYLTGFTGSNGQLLLTPDGGLLLTDGRYAEQARREVPDLPIRLYTGELAEAFAAACADLGVRRVAFEASGVTYRTYARLAETGVELVPRTDDVERLRWVKDPEEVELIRAAQAIVDDAFDLVVGKLAEGMAEREVALELETAMRRSGAEGPAFPTIVAFGEGAAEPHHRPTDRRLARGDVVKVDFGCVVGGYHSDMTRTVALGEPPPQIREVHEVVRRAQRAGVEAVRAGVTGGDADRAARRVIEEAGFGERFRHSLGHGVGLEIHEGPYLRDGGTDSLPEGAVVTVEPGVYLEGVGGVRIEDMVVVTAEGCEVLPRTTRDLVIL